jgi:transposase
VCILKSVFSDFFTMSGSFRLSSSERINVVKWYAQYENAGEVARQFEEHYNRSPPTRKTILTIARKFDETETIEDEPRSGRPRSISTDENRERVRAAFEEDPETSTRRASLELDLSRTSLRRMMKELGLKPYRPQLLHALNEDDPDRRCEFADVFLQLAADDSSFPDRILWTDEAIFKLNGHVNRHNCVYYAVENPHIVITKEINAPGITVWAGIWSGGLIGPFFFHDSVTANSYLEMLKKEIIPSIKSRMNLQEMFYMHDGAPSHYAQPVRHFLDKTFRNRWIGRRGAIEWPARSPDLTPTDFFLWGVIKDYVYAKKPQNLQALKDTIVTEMQSLPVELCRKAYQTVPYRLQLCKDKEGEHIEQYL